MAAAAERYRLGVSQELAMTDFANRRGWSWAAGLVWFVVVAGVAARPASTLAALTVPESDLPDGCRLNPAVTNTWMSLPTGIVTVPSNPWSGADHRLKAAVRSAVDGPPQMPDAPPLDRRGMASFESKWADDVAEAYHAEYVGTAGGPVLVSAVRFKDANHAIDKLPGLGAQRSLSTRFVLGAMAIRASGSSNLECFQAVSKYLQSLR